MFNDLFWSKACLLPGFANLNRYNLFYITLRNTVAVLQVSINCVSSVYSGNEKSMSQHESYCPLICLWQIWRYHNFLKSSIFIFWTWSTVRTLCEKVHEHALAYSLRSVACYVILNGYSFDYWIFFSFRERLQTYQRWSKNPICSMNALCGS